MSMREIKFRGKFTSENQLIPHPNEGRWVYGDLVHKAIFHCGKYTDAIYECGNAIPVDSDTVGQFTGLYDKNGVKIFEGDIIRFVNGQRKVNGEWVDNEFIYTVKYSEGAFHGVLGLSKTLDAVEVIGNIYDNPELLNHE